MNSPYPRINQLYDLAALLAGAVFPFAFAPFEYSAIAYLSLAVVFYVWQTAAPLRAGFRGFLFGLGQFAVGVSWIYISLHEYAGSSVIAAWVITAGCIVFLAGFPALAGFLSAAVGRTSRSLQLLAASPMAWIFCEWLRAWLAFPGFPWLQVGYSQVSTIPGGLAPLLGVYGVGLFVAFSVCGFLYVLQSHFSKAKFGLLAIIMLWLIASVFYQFRWTSPTDQSVRVALLQGNIPQNVKWLAATKKRTLRWYIDHTRKHWTADLIVWPETAVPAKYHQVQTLFSELDAEARKHRSDLLIGVPIHDRRNQSNYNAVMALGSRHGRYLKRHLVPFGEYLPLPELAGYISRYMDFRNPDFRPGNPDQPPLQAAGLPIAMSICYEDVFGQESMATMPQALLLVNVTNDAWFGRSIALDQNLQMARMRALESGRYMLRAANTGMTAVISPLGEVLDLAPPFTATVLTTDVQPMAGTTVYIQAGDTPVLLFIGLGLLLALAMRSRSHRNNMQ